MADSLMLQGFNTSLFNFLYRGAKQDTTTCDISLIPVDILEILEIFLFYESEF